MKYLKHFEKISHKIYKPKLSPKIIDNIKDICLELEDSGFKVFKNQLSFNKLGERHEGFYPHIQFRKLNSEKFYYSEIDDFIQRIKSYVDSVGYRTIILFYKIYPTAYYDDERRIKIDTELTYVRIDFKKKFGF